MKLEIKVESENDVKDIMIKVDYLEENTKKSEIRVLHPAPKVNPPSEFMDFKV